METIWSILGLEPTDDISVIKHAYAEKAKTCHPEENLEGFLQLRRAYQQALKQAEGGEHSESREMRAGESQRGAPPPEPPPEIPAPVETGTEDTTDDGEDVPGREEEEDWTLPEKLPDDAPNPYEESEVIQKFLECYTGKQRNNPTVWMNYFSSELFLDAGWDPRFTALLLEKITQLEQTLPPNRELIQWLNVVYLRARDGSPKPQEFEGLEAILRIASKGPAPKRPRGNQFAMLQSFLDYRHLVSLAEAGRWDQNAMEGFRELLNRYDNAYIHDRCEQRGTPDCERHPAGLRVFIHFFRRKDLPETVYREAWARLGLKSAIMGRAKILYGPLRELVVERVPGIEGEAPENFLQLNRNLDVYLARIKAEPAEEEQLSAAFFEHGELQRALPSPRFVENQLLTYSKWRREEMGEGLVVRLLHYYQEHLDIPRAQEVVSGLAEDLRRCRTKRWSQEDAQADSEVPLSLSYRPFLRHWLNTAFYTARDPDSGMSLMKYLEMWFPYQISWSERFGARDLSQMVQVGSTEVTIDFYPLHAEYQIHGEPVCRPCLSWEQVCAVDSDTVRFLLLPITAAPLTAFPQVFQVLFDSLREAAVLQEEDQDFLARCLANQVCCLSLEDGTGKPIPPERVLPVEVSAEGGGRLYTASWYEDESALIIYRQTFSGRRVQESMEPEPDEDRMEKVRQRLSVLACPTYIDLSRVRKLPWHIYFTPCDGEEQELIHPELLEPDEDSMALDMGEEVPEVPLPMKERPVKDREGNMVPPEKLVTKEHLSALLARFTLGELERLELEWSQGRLVLCHDADRYACLYFENSFGRGDFWYALLADPEMYRTVDSDDLEYVPFGMGKLPVYSVFPSAMRMMQNMDLVLSQMGWQQLEAGGRGGWMWSSAVNLQNSKHKLLMAQQKLGGVPPHRGRNYLFKQFVFSRFPTELEVVDQTGARTETALRSGSYGLAADSLVRFMMGKLTGLRLAWTFRGTAGEPYKRHLILQADNGRFMMFWLQDDKQRADAYAADSPVRFRGRVFPACLVHQDLNRIRNGVDLLLDDIDNTEPVVDRPGEFVPLPYEEVWAMLEKE